MIKWEATAMVSLVYHENAKEICRLSLWHSKKKLQSYYHVSATELILSKMLLHEKDL